MGLTYEGSSGNYAGNVTKLLRAHVHHPAFKGMLREQLKLKPGKSRCAFTTLGRTGSMGSLCDLESSCPAPLNKKSMSEEVNACLTRV